MTITTDTNNDGAINATEQGSAGTDAVTVSLTGTGAVAGDTVTVNGVAHTITSDDLANGYTTTVTKPAEGATLTVTAFVTDQAGNVGASGSDSARFDTTAPTAPTVTITTDANNDGAINATEQGAAGTDAVTVSLTGTGAVAGDTVTVNGVAHTITSGDLANGYTTTVAKPAEGATLTVTAFVTDQAGNVGASGSDSARLDTTAPSATVSTLTVGDGNLSSTEVAGQVTISGTLSEAPGSGETVEILVGTTKITATVSTAPSDAAIFSATVPGSTLGTETAPTVVTAHVIDTVGNASTLATASYTIDTTAPTAPTVTITTDANNDGAINAAEQGAAGTDAVTVSLTGTGAVAGDTVTVNGVAHTITSGDLTNGYTTTVAKPAEGATLTVTAFVTDQAGNVGASGSDSARLDTVAPTAPTVTITTDANNDGAINAAEQGSAGTDAVTVSLTGTGAVAGDTVTVNGVAHTITSNDLANGYTTTVAKPAEGATLTVTAFVTDQAGNVGASGSDSARLDTVAPTGPTATITTDANNDGYINAAEQGSAGTDAVTVSLTGTGAVAGDTVTVNGVAHTITSNDLANGYTTTVAKPAEGDTLMITTVVTDQAGNVGASSTSRIVTLDTTAPSAPTVTITTDANNDGAINATEQGSATTETVRVTFAAGTVAGDTVTVNGGAAHTITSGDLANSYTTTVAKPAEGATLTVTAFVTDKAGNVGASGSDSARLDTVAPTGPTATITTDANNDGYINAAEQGSAGTDAVTVSLTGTGAVAGDTVTVNGVAHTITSNDLANGYTTTVAKPAEGDTLMITTVVTDQAGNVGASSTSRIVTLDTTAPSAPTVAITTDANNDRAINAAEQGAAGTDAVRVTFAAGTVAGDTVTVNGVAHTITSGDLANGYTTTVAKPAEGATLTVTAFVTDKAGNVGASGSDSARLDTVAPTAPTVTITTDANNDGYINAAEQGAAGTDAVTVSLTGTGAVAGDTVTVNGVAHTITSNDLANGYTTTVAKPAEGATLTVTAFVTDKAGNVGASGSDSAQLDTTAPTAPTVTITTDANNDGAINATEQGAATTETVRVTFAAGTVAGDTVTVNGGAAHTITSGDLTNGYTTTVAKPAEGATLTVTAAVTDQAGNVGASGSDSARLDTTAPGVSVTGISPDTGVSSTDGYTKAPGALTVSGTAEVGSTLSVVETDQTGMPRTFSNVTVDGTGHWSITTNANLPQGTSTFVATATDAAGNTATSSFTAHIDRTTPLIPTVGLTSATDTGASQTDGLTNNTAPSFTGTAEAGASVDVALDGTYLGTTPVASDGTWTLAYPANLPALADGSSHTARVTVTDLAGNSRQSADFTVTIDTTPPTTPTVALSNDTTDGGAGHNTDGRTSDATLTVSATASDVTRTYTVDKGTASATYTAPTADGPHTVVITDTDKAGNVASSSLSFTLDKTVTTPTVALTTDSTDGGAGHNTDRVTNNAALTVSAADADVTRTYQIGTAAATSTYTAPTADGTYTVLVTDTDTSGNKANSSLTFTLDKTVTTPTVALTTDSTDGGAGHNTDRVTNSAALTFSTADADVTRTYTVDGKTGSTYAAPTKDGLHTVLVTDTDKAGNVASSSTLSFTLDTSADADGTAASLSLPDVLINNVEKGTVSYTVGGLDSDATSETVTFTGISKSTGMALSLPVSGTAGPHTVDLSGFRDGTITTSLSITDAAGNTAKVAGANVTLDTVTVRPVVTGISDDTGSSPTDHITRDQTLIFTGTAEVGATIQVYLDNGDTAVGTALVDKSGVWSLDLTGTTIAEGTHTITAIATDVAGNQRASSNASVFGFTVDTTAPVIAVTSPTAPIEATTATGAAVTFSATTTDAVDGTDTVTYTEVVNGQTVTHASGDVFALGSHTLTATSTDAAGNVSTKDFTFTVQDTTAPAIAVTSPTAPIEATTATGAAVTFSATTTDAVDGTDTVTYTEVVNGQTVTHASGDVFALGSHTLTATSTDAAGNVSTKDFTFTVQDTTAPAITVTSPTAPIEATMATGAAVTFSATTTDAVDGTDTVTYTEVVNGQTVTHASGDVFALGSHTLTATSTDAAGNVSTQDFTFTVQDTTAPAIAVTSPTAPIEATTAAGAAVTFSATTTDAVDGTDTVTYTEVVNGQTVTHASGDVFALGSHTLTATSTDAAGNVSTKDFTFTVQDTTAPAITVTSPTAPIEATMATGAAVTFSATTTDAVDGTDTVTYTEVVNGQTVTHASGDVFALGSHTLTATSTDAAGNVSTKDFTFTVQDTTAPAIAVTSPTAPIEATSSAGAKVTFSATTTDAVDGTDTVTYTEVVNGQTVTHASGDVFALGSHTLTATSTDAAGNVSTKDFTFTVQDTTAPAIAVTSPTAPIEATTAAGAAVTFSATTTDAVDGTDTVTYTEVVNGQTVTHASGDVFALGSHTLTATSTDAAGNVSTKDFTFTVQDTTAPVVAIQGVSGASNVVDHVVSGMVGVIDAGSTVTVRDGTAVVGTAVVDATGHWSTALVFNDGGAMHNYALTATDTDASGNVGQSTSFAFNLDFTPNQSLFGTISHDVKSIGGQVFALYEGLLERAPDAVGAEAFAAQLKAGASLHDVTQAFLTSAEGQTHLNAADNAGFVEQLYETVLGRQGDAAGANGWISQLNAGVSRADVADSFVFSSENVAQFQSSLDKGVFVADAAASNVAHLYYGLLDRAPDAGGLQGFTDMVHNGASLTSVAQSLLSSAEYAALHPGTQTDQQYVDSLYTHALGRTADAGGEQGWLNALSHGSTRADVAVGIAESQEATLHLVNKVEAGWHLA